MELTELGERHPKLADDDLFILWFLRAFITEDENAAAESLVGGSNDKGIDAIFVDDQVKTVFILQGKYRKSISTKSESRSDVMGLASLAEALCSDAKNWATFRKGLKADVEAKLGGARHRVLKSGYQLQFHFVTTGRVSEGLAEEARATAHYADRKMSFQVTDGKGILRLFSDYLDGVAPPVPSLELEIEGAGGAGGGLLQRYDPKTRIEAWVFTMAGPSVASIYDEAGLRLFSRNVRGYLGETGINRGMENTLEKEPEFFWYFNNGITIVCDDAKRIIRQGRDILQVTNPQVINGQQTTRTIHKQASSGKGASVVVRVIRVPRDPEEGTEQFEALVSQIVGATNWQNSIRPSDLMCNDRRQIEIQRQFRKLGYLYIRKRQTRSEAKRQSGGHVSFMLKKEDLAQAVAACDLDPLLVREGKEGLFEERLYGKVFPNSDPQYLLPRYWLMNHVSSVARGYPERGYAKWVVLNFVWAEFSRKLKGRSKLEAYRRASERDRGEVLGPLERAIATVFKATLSFYRSKRGKGEKQIDVSSFFKRKGLDRYFAKYWRTGRGSWRGRFHGEFVKFSRQLSDYADGD